MNIPYLDLKRVNFNVQNKIDEVYQKIMETQWFIRGEYCKEFEQEFAAYCGAKYCVGVGNGLDAIRLILQGMGIGQGDEVIVSAHTFIATILAITYTGATPVLIDADMRTYNIALDKIEKKITSKTRAIIVVHLYGQAVNTKPLYELKNKYQIKIIEDAAQAHGARINGKMTGALGDAAAFSFYPGKNLGAMGDAGAVVTDDRFLADRVRALANYGSYKKYEHMYQGCNSRLDDLQAGFLSVKLPHLEEWNEERREMARGYQQGIRNDRITLPQWDNSDNHVFHVYPILCETRNELAAYLKNRGIETNVHYPTPVFRQRAYKELRKNEKDYPVTSRLCSQEISLPLYPGLTPDEQKYIIRCLNEYKEQSI